MKNTINAVASYESGKGLKFSEEDVYSDGCQPNTSFSFLVDVEFSAPDIPSLIEKLKDFHGVDNDENVMENACEEPGRLDIQVYENAEGIAASEREMKAWKAGELRLWLSCYSYKIEKVLREPAALE